MLPTYSGAIAQGSDSAIPAAANWISSLLLGQLGTGVAVLAIGGVGYSMLMGHTSPKASLRVILGCFIVFGAPAIAEGLVQLAHPTSASVPTEVFVAQPAAPAPVYTRPPAADPDPYAGASVPM